MSPLKLYLAISASNFEKICLSKSLFCTNEELDGEIYKKKNRSLSKPKKGAMILSLMTLIIYFDSFLQNNYITDSVHVLRNTQVHQNTNNYGKSIIELCSDSQLRILKKHKKIDPFLSQKKCAFNLNHIISVIDLSTNVIPVDICLLIKTASPPLFLLGSLLLQFM
jgi:hypothetical protein